MKYTTIILALVHSLFTSTLNAREVDPAKYSSRLSSFIADVVYEVEAGDRDKKFKKLAPHLKLQINGDKDSETIFNAKLKEFLAVTGVTNEKPEGSLTPTCDLRVYFGSTASIREKAAEIDKKIMFKDGATYWKWWDDNHTVIGAAIFISTDEFKGEKLEDRLVEILLGVFGLPSQSKSADNSCLSMEEDIKTSLQPLDIEVMKFLYQSVPAGARPSELKKLIRDKWDKR